MSNISVQALLDSFPYAMSGSEKIAMLTSLTAEELMELYEGNKILSFYARIDELDENILDALAVDFKIDWWDTENTLAEKRAVFKSCWAVHRKLGTPGAINAAIKPLYENATVSEWYDYGGSPYHYRINLELGSETMNPDKFARIVERAAFYVNLRSVMDEVFFNTQKNMNHYIGCCMQQRKTQALRCPGLEET